MSERLDIKDLLKVIDSLQKAGFEIRLWETLGMRLGLYPNTLSVIKINERDEVEGRFKACLSKWLKRVDNVDKVGKPSLSTLADALDKMNGCIAQAEYIRGLIKGDSSEEKPANSTNGGAQASAGIEETDGPAPQGPPQDKKKCKREDFTEDLVKDIEILLLPATDTEEKPVMEYLEQSSEEYIETDIDGTVKMYIGYYGKSKVIVSKIASDKSMQGPVHAAIITTKIIERVKSIKHIVAIGVCFGKDPEKHKLGEVIISEMICDFVSKRQGVNIELRRGGDYSVKPDTKKSSTLLMILSFQRILKFQLALL